MKTSRHLMVGESLAPTTLETLSHGTIRVPDEGTFTHLTFRRFAGCPVCNLHLRRLARARERLDAARVRTVAFFHSGEAQMRPYQGDLPFAVVADPERRFYRRFGVERSAAAVLHPKVVVSALVGLATAPSNPFVGGSEQGGLPADFLVSPDGIVVALKYGDHADDQWTVDEILAAVPTK